MHRPARVRSIASPQSSQIFGRDLGKRAAKHRICIPEFDRWQLARTLRRLGRCNLKHEAMCIWRRGGNDRSNARTGSRSFSGTVQKRRESESIRAVTSTVSATVAPSWRFHIFDASFAPWCGPEVEHRILRIPFSGDVRIVESSCGR